MPIQLPGGLQGIVGKLLDKARTGFQRSHVIGKDFAKRNLEWARGIGFDWNADYNPRA
jgi:hypothetical protein